MTCLCGPAWCRCVSKSKAPSLMSCGKKMFRCRHISGHERINISAYEDRTHRHLDKGPGDLKKFLPEIFQRHGWREIYQSCKKIRIVFSQFQRRMPPGADADARNPSLLERCACAVLG